MSHGTLLFSGTDLASLCDVVEDLSDFWATSDPRGDLPVYNGVPGATATRRPIAEKVRTAQVSMTDGATLAATEDKIATLKAGLRLNRSQTVTRRKIVGAGNLDTTQTAIVRSAEERWLNETTCTLLIAVETIDGPWFGASESIAAVGTVTIKGDSPTRAITATLSAGAVNPVVTNTTNGYTFRYVGTVPAGGVTVDIRTRKATKVSDSSDVSSALKWSKSDPFQLDPGSQTLTISTGTASFTYLPAYV
jgi:hypothetical protein